MAWEWGYQNKSKKSWHADILHTYSVDAKSKCISFVGNFKFLYSHEFGLM